MRLSLSAVAGQRCWCHGVLFPAREDRSSVMDWMTWVNARREVDGGGGLGDKRILDRFLQLE